CAGIKPYRSGTHHTWTEEQIEQFERAWPIGTKERTAFALHLWTAQRSQDVRRMSWAAVSNDVIRVIQGKTGEKLAIPVHPDLHAALAEYPRKHHVIL